MQVSKGDRCLIKRSGGNVEAATTIQEAATFEDLTPEDVETFQSAFGSGLSFESEYWSYHQNANYITLIRFSEFVPATLPKRYTPKGVQIGWVAGFEHFDQANLKAQTPLHL
jgi:hypothetical protein